MRLLDNEYTAIVELMTRFGFEEVYSLVKRKGWIYIEISDHVLIFHRKKTTKLNNGQFVSCIEYFVRENGKVLKVESFTPILSRLEAILLKLSLK